MAKHEIHAPGAPRPIGPFSHALRAGDFLFVSGQGPDDPETGEIVGATIEEQTARTLANLETILSAGGASMADVVKCTVWLGDLSTFGRFNAVYAAAFPDPKPTRATVGAALLRGIMVEIDAVAYLGA